MGPSPSSPARDAASRSLSEPNNKTPKNGTREAGVPHVRGGVGEAAQHAAGEGGGGGGAWRALCRALNTVLIPSSPTCS